MQGPNGMDMLLPRGGNINAPRLTRTTQQHTPSSRRRTATDIKSILDPLAQGESYPSQLTRRSKFCQAIAERHYKGRTRRDSRNCITREMHGPNRTDARLTQAARAHAESHQADQLGRVHTPPIRSSNHRYNSSFSSSRKSTPHHLRRPQQSASDTYYPSGQSHTTNRRKGSGTMLSSASNPPPPHMRGRVDVDIGDWKTWQEVKVKIHNFPSHTTAADIHQLLKDIGEISKIDVVQETNTLKTAWVYFSPPPSRAFWSEQWQLSGTRFPLRMFLCSPPQQRRVASAINPTKEYPARITISAESIEFGILYSESAMMVMQKASSEKFGIHLTLDLNHSEIHVQFPLEIFNDQWQYSMTEQYRLDIPLQRLRDIREEQLPDKRILLIPLDCPPRVFLKVRDVQMTFDQALFWSDRKTWFRQTDITHLRSHLADTSTMLRKKNAIIDIGRWTTYRLEFNTSEIDMVMYQQFCEALTDWNVNIVRDLPTLSLPMEPPALWDIVDAPVSSPRSSASPAGLLNRPISLDFDVRYQLEVCLSNNVLNEHNITREFIERLSTMDKNMAKAALEVAVDKKKRIYEPMDIFKLPLGKKAMPKEVPSYCVYSRAAQVTPTTVMFSSPTMEVSNRVIRNNIKFSDRFLRVRFTEDKPMGKIFGSDGRSDDEIFNRIWRTLRNGITVGDRHYDFLAFGNSQFRENGAYFFTSTEGDPDEENNLTCEDIRDWMGEFDEIKEVARYASRMGQCFSTTRAVTGVTAEISGHEDITRNGYNFTDGVGRISPSLAQQIAVELGHPNAHEDTPSVFQFRLGGCKGVLAVSPELQGNEVHVRRSQDKFPAPNDGLEIIKWSQFATATLNRQLIIVLDNLGVPETIFMKKLRGQLSDLNKAMSSEDVAIRLLQRHVDFNQVTLVLAEMVLDGFMRVKEPFLMSMLRLWRTWSIKYLKEKAKLFVGDGAFLLGCVDETACLRGHFFSEQNIVYTKNRILPEIFVQVSDSNHQGRYKVIEGVCIVARNPSLHAGDIRVVRAVNKPELHHLKNVVVFPQTGDRDIPNMCSGGDLDGDDYLVVWDQELIPKIINHEPMDFTPPPKKIVDKVTIQDIQRFFVEYIKNDSLGKIATAHLIAADSEDAGVMSEKCLQLARIHSIAVDYPKSGIPAHMSGYLKAKSYPHFMQKDKTYKSTKILGKLYDAVEEVNFNPQYDTPFDSRILKAYILEPAMLDRARAVKELYDVAVRRIMAQHSIQTEFEVWSTFILSHGNVMRDYDLQENFGRLRESLRERFQKLCYEEAAGGFEEGVYGADEKGARAALQETGRAFKNLGPFVAAMYTVTAQEILNAVEHTRETKVVADLNVPPMKMKPDTMPLMSFPWIFARELGLIATGAKDHADGFDGFDNHAQLPKKQQSMKKSKPTTVAAGNWTKEDEVWVDGDVVKHGELIDLFHETGKTESHNAPAPAGQTTPGNVSNRQAAPIAPIALAPAPASEPASDSGSTSSLDKVMKQLEGLIIQSRETKPRPSTKAAAKPAPQPPKPEVVQSATELDDTEGLYTDDGPYPSQSLNHPYFTVNLNASDSPRAQQQPPTAKPAATVETLDTVEHDTAYRDPDYLATVLGGPSAWSTADLVLHSPPPSIASPPPVPGQEDDEEDERPISALAIPPPVMYTRDGTPVSRHGSVYDDGDDTPLVAEEEVSEYETRRILGRGRVGAIRSRARLERVIEEQSALDGEEKKTDDDKEKAVDAEHIGGDVAEEVALRKKKGKSTWDMLKRFA